VSTRDTGELLGLSRQRRASGAEGELDCRKAMLGAGFVREIETVRKIAGTQTPIAGFLTYGEIARSKGKLERWHNATTVVVGIPA